MHSFFDTGATMLCFAKHTQLHTSFFTFTFISAGNKQVEVIFAAPCFKGKLKSGF